MTRDELLAELRTLAGPAGYDTEIHHQLADQLLLTYIDDPEIAEAYAAIEKWYA